jgi:hypothetical protein
VSEWERNGGQLSGGRIEQSVIVGVFVVVVIGGDNDSSGGSGG